MELDLRDFTGKIYIDTNILLYSAFNHPNLGESCRNFLERVDRGRMEGYVSDFVLNEVFHKLMVAEVTKKFKISTADAIFYIRANPKVISELETIWEEMKLIEESNIVILKNTTVFPEFVQISRKYDLMATDAFHVTVMRKSGIRTIATFDRDFERVDFIRVLKPQSKKTENLSKQK
jgi:predicted nucleic acid-binding protein